MIIKTQPLSAEEKKKLRLVFRFRLIFGLIIAPLLIGGLGFLSMQAADQIRSGTSDGMSFFALALTALVIFLIFRFVVPFYRNSFKNLKLRDKLVVDTIVLKIEQRTTNKGQKYAIQTEYMYIDSWAISPIMKQRLYLHEMYVNMPITIHCLAGNMTDILYIEKTNSEGHLHIL
jgi:hypothetical protein